MKTNDITEPGSYFFILKGKLDLQLLKPMQRVRDLPPFPSAAHMGDEEQIISPLKSQL